MSELSAEELVTRAEGPMKTKHLTKTGGIVSTYLYDKPLIEYLRPNEQPEYYFKHYNKGIVIEESDGTENTPHHSGSGGGRYLLVTDQRLLYVAGEREGDSVREFEYDELVDVEYETNTGTSSLTVQAEDRTVYTFPVNKYARSVDDAADHVRKKLDGTETETDNRTSTESERSASGRPTAETESDEIIDRTSTGGSPGGVLEGARGDITESELTSSGGKLLKVGYFAQPVVSYLGADEQVHFVLRNYTDGLDVGSKTLESADDRRSVAVLTDRRVLFVIGRNGDGADTTVSVEFSQIIKTGRDDRTLVLVEIDDTDGEAKLYQFPVKNDDQLSDAVGYLKERIGGPATLGAIEQIDNHVQRARQHREDGQYPKAIELVETALDLYDRYNQLVEQLNSLSSDLQNPDVEELTDISGVGESKAERLREAGYRTVADVRETTQDELSSVDGIGGALAARITADLRDLKIGTEMGSGGSGVDTAPLLSEDELRDLLTDIQTEQRQSEYESQIESAEQLAEDAQSLVEDGRVDAGLEEYEDAIETYRRAIDIAEQYGVGDRDSAKRRREEMVDTRKSIRLDALRSKYDECIENAENHIETADDHIQADELEDAIAAYDEAIEAYQRAIEVGTDTGVGNLETIENQIMEVERRREELQMSTLGQRTAEVTVPASRSGGAAADFRAPIATLREILERIESINVERTEDLALIREEAATKLIRARLNSAEQRARAAVRAFQEENYREAQKQFNEVEEDLTTVASDAEDRGIGDFDERIERLREACGTNADAARRASLGLTDEISLEPLGEETDRDRPAGRDASDVAAESTLEAPSGIESGSARQEGGTASRSGDGRRSVELEGGFSYDSVEKNERIGSGGNADVHRAVVTVDGESHTVALKEPRTQGTLTTGIIDQFISEADTWSKLDDHPHVVSVLEYDATPVPWIVLEYMEMGDLAANATEMTVDEKFDTAIAVADGVWHAHQRGVAHLDLKPANILLTEVDGQLVPKVADWGLAKMLLDNSNSVEGLSPQYSAPEQFDSETYGTPDNRTDIYQLGLIFYEFFTGEHPVQGPPTEIMRLALNETPDPPSTAKQSIPAELDEIIMKTLAKDKTERYEAVVYLRDALQQAAHR